MAARENDSPDGNSEAVLNENELASFVETSSRYGVEN